MTSPHRAPDPREARTSADFLALLQSLKDWSGLTYRELSARAEALGEVLPRSTVANMLSRATVPREELLTTFVRACGLPPDAVADWQEVRKELAVRGAYEPPATEPAALREPDEREPEEREPEERAPEPEVASEEPEVAPGAPESGAPVAPGAPEPAARRGRATRASVRRGLVTGTAIAGLVLAGFSVVAFLRDGNGTRPPRTAPAAPTEPVAPAAGDVRIRVVASGLCLGERRGTRSGQIHQLSCAETGVPHYALEPAGGGRWRILSDHPDYGPGCSGIPSGGRIPGAAYEDSECGDPSRIETFTLEPYGTPVTGYRIVPHGAATPGTCVTVTGDRSAPWSPLAQAPCTPDAAGQLFGFDRRTGDAAGAGTGAG
ncbi:RICIN domain-containing protein [Streptomyces sp. NPDC003327]